MQAVKAAVSSALLWILFSRIDLDRFLAAGRHARPVWVAAALGLYLLAVLVSSWRWHRLLLLQDVKLPFWRTVGSFIVALFFNNFLPTNIGGDVMRIRDTAAAAGSSARAATVVVADRVVGLLGLMLVAAVSAVSANIALFPMSWIWAALAALAAASMVMWLATRSRRLLSLWESALGNRIRAFAGGITGALLNFRAAPVGLALAFAAAVCNHAALIAFYYAVAVALNVPVGLADMAVIVPILSLAQVIPVSINGLGVREATFTVLFARIGLSPENALAVSLGATALIIGFSSLGACLYVARGRTSGSELLSTPAPHLVSSAWRT